MIDSCPQCRAKDSEIANLREELARHRNRSASSSAFFFESELERAEARVKELEKHDCERWLLEGKGCAVCGNVLPNIKPEDLAQAAKEVDWECVELRERVKELEAELWDALLQGAIVDGDKLDNCCMSTWEHLSAYFEKKGWLKTDNRRIYKIVPAGERPK